MDTSASHILHDGCKKRQDFYIEDCVHIMCTQWHMEAAVGSGLRRPETCKRYFEGCGAADGLVQRDPTPWARLE